MAAGGGCSSLSAAGWAAIFVVNPAPDRAGEEARPREPARPEGVWRERRAGSRRLALVTAFKRASVRVRAHRRFLR